MPLPCSSSLTYALAGERGCGTQFCFLIGWPGPYLPGPSTCYSMSIVPTCAMWPNEGLGSKHHTGKDHPPQLIVQWGIHIQRPEWGKNQVTIPGQPPRKITSSFFLPAGLIWHDLDIVIKKQKNCSSCPGYSQATYLAILVLLGLGWPEAKEGWAIVLLIVVSLFIPRQSEALAGIPFPHNY